MSDEVEIIFWETEKLVIGSFLENGFEATLRLKTNGLSIFGKGNFLCFWQFLTDEVEIILWESKTKCLKLFKSKFGQRNLLRKWFRSFVELKSQYCERLKIAFFYCFPSFWLMKLKPFCGKVRQSVQNYLNQNLVIGSFLENDFVVTLSSKTNVLSIWKGHFSVFCKFLSDEVEIIFWESKTDLSRPIKFKVGHRKLFRK